MGQPKIKCKNHLQNFYKFRLKTQKQKQIIDMAVATIAGLRIRIKKVKKKYKKSKLQYIKEREKLENLIQRGANANQIFPIKRKVKRYKKLKKTYKSLYQDTKKRYKAMMKKHRAKQRSSSLFSSLIMEFNGNQIKIEI